MRNPLAAKLLCIGLGSLLASAPGLARELHSHRISVVPEQPQQAQIERLLGRTQRGVAASELAVAVRGGRAGVSLVTMFSAQQGSWPFEPFVHNGLFRAIASYQAHHPRAVLVQGGRIDLAGLYRALGDERIMSRHKDGYLLSYPLLIGPDASLDIADTTLYLRIHSGTALINRGTLSLRRAVLTSWSGGQPAELAQPFRPFVTAWAGSHTRILDSSLLRLGYNGQLVGGLTLARSALQPRGDAPATLLVRDSRLRELSSGAVLQQAVARIERSHFDELQQYGLDLQDSRASLLDNRIAAVKNRSGIRLRGDSDGTLVEGNLILATGKAGIEVLEQRGALLVRGNLISDTRGNGILLRQSGGGVLLLAHNYIANTRGSGLEGDAAGTTFVLGNRINSTPEYAVSFRNAAGPPTHLVLLANQFANVGKAMLRTEGVERMVLGHNRFQVGRNSQPLLAGDLMPVQSLLLEATVRQPCVVEVLANTGAVQPPPQTAGCQAEAPDGTAF
ncbi:Periplasmic copper-binding protein (NosD) [compost metagenome]